VLPDLVVVISPNLNQKFGFLWRIEHFSVQQFILHLSCNGFDLNILQRTAMFDKPRPDRHPGEELAQLLGDNLPNII